MRVQKRAILPRCSTTSLPNPASAADLALFLGVAGLADRIEDKEQSFSTGNLTHQADLRECFELVRLDIIPIKQRAVVCDCRPNLPVLICMGDYHTCV